MSIFARLAIGFVFNWHSKWMPLPPSGHCNPLTPIAKQLINSSSYLSNFSKCTHVFIVTFQSCRADPHLLQIGMICYITVLSQGYNILHDHNTDTNLSKWLFRTKKQDLLSQESSPACSSVISLSKRSECSRAHVWTCWILPIADSTWQNSSG